jgi:hypothetical protein
VIYNVPKRPRRLELVTIDGHATEVEREAIADALEELAAQQHEAASASMWLRAGRAQGRRLGMFDYRDRFSREDTWRLSARFPFGGREYQGLLGRGDAR